MGLHVRVCVVKGEITSLGNLRPPPAFWLCNLKSAFNACIVTALLGSLTQQKWPVFALSRFVFFVCCFG